MGIQKTDMFKVALLGKKYHDKIYNLESFAEGETNPSKTYLERLGGAHNFLDSSTPGITFTPMLRGSKLATIFNDLRFSTRTSVTADLEKTIYTSTDINTVNSKYSWAHVCYIDDIQDFRPLLDITTPLSLDFCTNAPRHQFMDIMSRSEVVFDSRERKHLYKDLHLRCPLVLHDEFGVEVIKSNIRIYKSDMVPVSDLEVNGAGDIFAKNFIKNFIEHDILKSSTKAMEQTTQHLLRRNTNEKTL